MSELFHWFWSLMQGIGSLWNWLITPLPTLSALVGFNIAPLYLIGSSALVVGIVRAIL